MATTIRLVYEVPAGDLELGQQIASEIQRHVSVEYGESVVLISSEVLTGNFVTVRPTRKDGVVSSRLQLIKTIRAYAIHPMSLRALIALVERAEFTFEVYDGAGSSCAEEIRRLGHEVR